MEEFWYDDEESWMCRKHPSQPRTGVCPTCLRNRLLCLCPECAKLRPCGCSASLSTSSSTTNSSSSLSLSLSSDTTAGSGGEASIGAVGRVGSLIESEPAFRRSRSTAFHRLIPRSDAGGWKAEGKGMSWLWPFKAKKRGEMVVEEAEEVRVSTVEEKEKRAVEVAAAVRLYRSRSVGMPANVQATPYKHPPGGGGGSGSGGGGGGGGGGVGEVKWKGWNWYFPSPMKAFGHRSKTSRVVHERSPLCRG